MKDIKAEMALLDSTGKRGSCLDGDSVLVGLLIDCPQCPTNIGGN